MLSWVVAMAAVGLAVDLVVRAGGLAAGRPHRFYWVFLACFALTATVSVPAVAWQLNLTVGPGSGNLAVDLLVVAGLAAFLEVVRGIVLGAGAAESGQAPRAAAAGLALAVMVGSYLLARPELVLGYPLWEQSLSVPLAVMWAAYLGFGLTCVVRTVRLCGGIVRDLAPSPLRTSVVLLMAGQGLAVAAAALLAVTLALPRDAPADSVMANVMMLGAVAALAVTTVGMNWSRVARTRAGRSVQNRRDCRALDSLWRRMVAIDPGVVLGVPGPEGATDGRPGDRGAYRRLRRVVEIHDCFRTLSSYLSADALATARGGADELGGSRWSREVVAGAAWTRAALVGHSRGAAPLACGPTPGMDGDPQVEARYLAAVSRALDDRSVRRLAARLGSAD